MRQNRKLVIFVFVRVCATWSGNPPVPTCSTRQVGRVSGRRTGFVGLTGLAASALPGLLGWGLLVTVCAWSVCVSVWVGPL